jgi:hypothetical protein
MRTGYIKNTVLKQLTEGLCAGRQSKATKKQMKYNLFFVFILLVDLNGSNAIELGCSFSPNFNLFKTHTAYIGYKYGIVAEMPVSQFINLRTEADYFSKRYFGSSVSHPDILGAIYPQRIDYRSDFIGVPLFLLINPNYDKPGKFSYRFILGYTSGILIKEDEISVYSSQKEIIESVSRPFPKNYFSYLDFGVDFNYQIINNVTFVFSPKIIMPLIKYERYNGLMGLLTDLEIIILYKTS